MIVDGESKVLVPSPPQALELVAALPGHSDRAWTVTWSPTERLLASCSTDKTVRLFSFAGKGKAAKFDFQGSISTGHSRTVRSLQFSPGGASLALASFDSTVSIWERTPASPGASPTSGEWECVSTLEGHDSECKAVAWSASGGLLASCSRDKSVWVWEVQPDADFECLAVMLNHTQDVKTLSFHPFQDILASASYDDTIHLSSDSPLSDWEPFQTLKGHRGTVWALAWEPTAGNWLASAGDEGEIRFWEKRGSDVESPWRAAVAFPGTHSRTVYSLSWLPAPAPPADQPAPAEGEARSLGKLASAGGDGFIRVFDVIHHPAREPPIDLVLLHELEEAHGVAEVNSVSWAPALPSAGGSTGGAEGDEGALLASAGDDGAVKVWVV